MRAPKLTWLPETRVASFAVLYGTAACVALLARDTSAAQPVVAALAFPLGWGFAIAAALLAGAGGPPPYVFAAALGVGLFLNGYLWGHVARVLVWLFRRVARSGAPPSEVAPN